MQTESRIIEGVEAHFFNELGKLLKHKMVAGTLALIGLHGPPLGPNPKPSVVACIH